MKKDLERNKRGCSRIVDDSEDNQSSEKKAEGKYQMSPKYKTGLEMIITSLIISPDLSMLAQSGNKPKARKLIII